MDEEAHHLSDAARLQVLLAPGNAISTNGSVMQLIIAGLLAASKEVPEPTGEGRIKQPTRRWFTHISP